MDNAGYYVTEENYGYKIYFKNTHIGDISLQNSEYVFFFSGVFIVPSFYIV